VFVTPLPSPSAASIGPSIETSTGSPTLRPRLSDIFAAQVPDIPVLAGPSVTLGVDFIQINCGKRISDMALLEQNVRNKIAVILEPYTSINGCTLIHKRDCFSSGTAPPGTIPTGTVPATSTS
jgi:hypothetical protein